MLLENLTPHIQTATSFLIAVSGLLAILGAFFKPVRSWISKRFADSEERKKEKEEHQQEVLAIKAAIEKTNLRLDEYKDILGKDREEQKLLKEALVGMLRDRLTTIYNQAETRGYIDTTYRANFIEMYDIYRSLGGNHYVHDLYEKIKTMPGKPPRTTKKKVVFWSADTERAIDEPSVIRRPRTTRTRTRAYTRN